jgi:hypothetical protein
VGALDEPFLEGRTVLAGLAAVTSRCCADIATRRVATGAASTAGNIDAAQFDAKPLAFADRTSVAPVAHDFEDAIKRLVFTGGGSRITGEAPRLCRSTTDTSA